MDYVFVRCSQVITEDADQIAFSFTCEGGNLDLKVGAVRVRVRTFRCRAW